MRNWGRFKTEGSIIAVAMGAIAAGILTDDDLFGPEPERPRLSDPDSDALYAPPAAADRAGAQQAAPVAGDPSNIASPAAKVAPEVQSREPDPEKPERRRARARSASAGNGTAHPSPSLAEITAPAPPLAGDPQITLALVTDTPASLAEPPSQPIAENDQAPAPATGVVVATPLPFAMALAAGRPVSPEAPAARAPEVPAPVVASVAIAPPAAAPDLTPAPPAISAPALAIPAETAPPVPLEAAAAQPDVPAEPSATAPKRRAARQKAATDVAVSSPAIAPVTTSIAASPRQPAGKPKPASRLARTAKAAPSIATDTARAAPAGNAPPRSLADIRARLSPRAGSQATNASSFPAGAKPAPPLTLADVRARLDRSSGPDLALPPASASAAGPDSTRIIVPGLTNAAQQDGGLPSEMLALAPIVNGVPIDTIITVERLGDGGFRVRAGDLRALRVILDPTIGDEGIVALSSLPGVTARYVEASQSLALSIPDALLIPTLIDARGGRQPVDLTKIVTTSGVLFNYRLFGTAQSGDGRDVRLTGDTEFVGMTPLGLFVTNGTFATSGGRAFVRGDSFFRYEDIARVMTVTVGDFATGALNFSRSVRLGGIQVQSDFQQRPDLFTGPLPQFAGSAALPSALELYADNLKVFSTNVPPGPFVLRSLPQITGNELRIVTIDANGRQTEITTPYFDAPGLLRKGIVEYSAELGAPRINAGIRSFDYRSKLFGSATARYGLGDRLTLEGHIEAGGDLVNGGLGIIRALGPLGSVTAAASVSSFRGRKGTRLSGQYRFDLNRFSLFASVEREYGRYFDLGDVSSFRGRVTDPTGTELFPRRSKRSLERIGASFRPSFDPTSFNIAYNRLRLGDSEIRTANFGVRRRITNRISFRGDALFDLKRRGDVALSAGLDIRLGRNTSAFTGADRANGRTSYDVSVNGFSGGRQNALGYSIAQRGNDDGDAFRSASLNYRLPQAFVAGSIDQSGKNVRGSLQVEGSVIAAGKDVFVANRVGEGFAIVKNAGPSVDILQGGRKIARSNSKGRALLSSLEAFNEVRVAIDPTSLPAGLEAENGTDFRIVTRRRRAALVDFGVRKVNAAIVVILGPDGKAIPPGTLISLGGGESGLMGYDGEVFLKDLKANNSVSIDLGAAGKCTASFSYDTEGEAQPLIGPIKCF